MGFVQKFQPIGPSGVEWLFGYVIRKQKDASINIAINHWNVETIKENCSKHNNCSSSTKQKNDILCCWFVDHISVNGTKFDFKLWITQFLIVLLDENIRENREKYQNQDFQKWHDYHCVTLSLIY